MNLEYQLNDDNVVIKLNNRIEIKNAPEVEEAIFKIVKENPRNKIILDAENLEYISSVGLRIIIKLKKTNSADIEIINTSNDVYDIFETTAITSIIPISRKLREIPIDNLEEIEKGETGTVYRLDDETIIKAYNENIPLEMVKKEREIAQKVFVYGIPTAISFDIVKTGNSYGVVFELVDSDSFLNYMRNNTDNLKELGAKFANLMKEVNSIIVEENSNLPDRKAELIEDLVNHKEYFNEEEFTKFKHLLETIPDASNYIHGDLHPGNVMMQGDELVLIDMVTSGKGHPIIDLIGAAGLLQYPKLSAGNDPDRVIGYSGLTVRQSDEFFRSVLENYFDTTDEDEIDQISNYILGRTIIRTLNTVIEFMKGTERGEQAIQHGLKVKDVALALYDDIIESDFVK